MKKEIIIITNKAHNKPVYELLKKWGFDYNDGEFEEAAEIYYCSPDDDLRYGTKGYLYGDIEDYIKRKIPYTIYLSSDILANPEIVGTFEGAKQMEEPLLFTTEWKDKVFENIYKKTMLERGLFGKRYFKFFMNLVCDEVIKFLNPPSTFQLTRSWIESKKRYFYNSTSSQNAFTYAIEIVAKELGLTIKEDK